MTITETCDITAHVKGLLPDMQQELERILNFWTREMLSEEKGNVIGAMDHYGKKFPDAPKGAVLYARILWTFATAAQATGNTSYAATAEAVYQYFNAHFFDQDFGGIYWSVDAKGQPLETKKQVYAQGFGIYALSAFYKLTGNAHALKQAIELYELLEATCYDPMEDGYIEACNRNWETIDDLRLSSKDANEKKTMNTHLHVLEGYAQLYKVWPDAGLKHQIKQLLMVFRDKIIQPATHTMGLFFDENWERKDNLISFGHDIEASWLLQEAAESIGDRDWIQWSKKNAIMMAEASTKGIDKDGGMWHEWDNATQHLVKEKHWWPQAEAMVGFMNAWQNSDDNSFLERLMDSWKFIQQYLILPQYGEWKWGVYEDYSLMENEDLAGFWKCPYHNGRACLELIHRLQHY
ncbi:MAG: AGE family epimerase/isomerase [Chitinophagaceae bacterium]|nr:AGE family epimerase/isomerase [Chitinophagaceae bacterium]